MLQNVVAAYRAAPSYADAGEVRLVGNVDGKKVEQTDPFAITLVRPNKIRMEVYQAMVVCDGNQLHAAVQDLPGQVVAKQAPHKLTIDSVYTDPILAGVLNRGVGAWRLLILLLEDDPLKALLQKAEGTTLAKSGTIAGRDCYRVEVKRAYGTTVLWIDQESYVLRRIVFPSRPWMRQPKPTPHGRVARSTTNISGFSSLWKMLPGWPVSTRTATGLRSSVAPKTCTALVDFRSGLWRRSHCADSPSSLPRNSKSR